MDGKYNRFLLSGAIYCTEMKTAYDKASVHLNYLGMNNSLSVNTEGKKPVKLYNIPQEVHQSALPGYGRLDTIGKLHSVLAFLLTQGHSRLQVATVWLDGVETS